MQVIEGVPLTCTLTGGETEREGFMEEVTHWFKGYVGIWQAENMEKGGRGSRQIQSHGHAKKKKSWSRLNGLASQKLKLN